MKHLTIPMSNVQAARNIGTMCTKYAWGPHEQAWKEACASYYQHKGNPWKIAPIELPIKDAQYDLYDSRKGGGPLLKLRKTPGLLSCPMCGSSTTGHLDHYLPRVSYQEFSILQANLVPACGHCNSGSKGKTVKGDHRGERFIHPYFDRWADKPLWYITFVPPYRGVRFKPSARKSVFRNRETITAYHLKNVLGDQFQLSMATKWSTLPRDLRIRIKASIPNALDVEVQVKEELKSAIATSGENSWNSAFFRGLVGDEAAMSFILAQILAL